MPIQGTQSLICMVKEENSSLESRFILFIYFRVVSDLLLINSKLVDCSTLAEIYSNDEGLTIKQIVFSQHQQNSKPEGKYDSPVSFLLEIIILLETLSNKSNHELFFYHPLFHLKLLT